MQGPPVVTKVFAYAGGQYTNQINSFEVDKTTGALNPTSQPSIASQTLPMTQDVLFNKKFLLSVNYSSHSFSVYGIEAASGNLSLIANTDLGAGTGPIWVTAHPSLPVAYVTQLGNAKIAIIDIDPDTGAATVRGTLNGQSGVTATEINKAGTILYSADQNVDQVGIYSVDNTGGLTLVGHGSCPAGSNPNEVKIHPSGNFLYTANWTTGDVSGFAINGTTLTPINTLGGGSGGVYTVSLSPDGNFLYANKPYGAQMTTMSIDPVTGTLSSAVNETITGAVNVSFWGDFAFLVAWQGGGGEPILTRPFVSGTGFGATSSQTANVIGLYNLVIVEIVQPAGGSN